MQQSLGVTKLKEKKKCIGNKHTPYINYEKGSPRVNAM